MNIKKNGDEDSLKQAEILKSTVKIQDHRYSIVLFMERTLIRS